MILIKKSGEVGGELVKNPLRKRYLRELRSDFGKYAVIFLFIIMLIGLVSGFLIADKNAHLSYMEGFEKYRIEDGHLAFDKEPEESLLAELEIINGLKFYDLRYFEELLNDTEKNIRVYVNRELVNMECLMSGQMPTNATDIALDRLFAVNAGIKIGDSISLHGKQLTVTGLVAFPDYSCLFENNTDMMFDSINFGVGVMTPQGFRQVGSKHVTYNYAWEYDESPLTELEENEKSEALIDSMKEVIKSYDTKILQDIVDERYEQALVLQDKLEAELTEASKIIEKEVEDASVRAMEDALAYLPKGRLLEITMDYLDEDEEEDELLEQILKSYADTLDTTMNGLIVSKLKTETSLEAFESMVDALDSFEDRIKDMKDTTNRPVVNLEDIEESKNYESELEISLDELKDVINKVRDTQLYDTSAINEMITDLENLSDIDPENTGIIRIKDYVPRYQNKAITFTGEDMGSDAAMISVFNDLVVAILAFIFAVTISGTIAKEATVIGTLRATGYSKNEIIRHFLTLPMIVTITACIIGNALGYTVFEKLFIDVYYRSYSLAVYERHFNLDAFVRTTVLTIVMMFVINLFVLIRKMALSPLQFLRRELSKKKKRRAVLLDKRIPFMIRFRLRILFQNISSYFILMLGIVLGGAIIVFGAMFGPLFETYGTLVEESKIANYQYVLMDQVETTYQDAEKYCVTELDLEKEGFVTDSVMIYGIQHDSSYVNRVIPDGQILISNGMAIKYDLSEGEELTMKDHYTGKEYSFSIGGVYRYDAALAVFVNREEYIDIFHEEADYYTGYLSDVKLADIEADNIASVITEKDLRKIVDQMTKTMGNMMGIFKVFGVVMFMLMIFLLTKQVIEKNQLSISMTKILGFQDTEIGGLYLIMSFVVVVISLLVSVPIIHEILRYAFEVYIYKVMSGYVPFIISSSCYVNMILLGVISFIVVSLFLMVKIGKIPKSEALKNVE